MTTVFARLRNSAAKRAAYHRTVSELTNLPLDVALDLDIDRAQASRIAHRAVYGY